MQLRLLVGHPLYATVIFFCIGTLYLFISSLTVHTPWPSLGRRWQVPWWAWTGGVLGATYLLFAILVAPRLGAPVLVGLIVAGQLAASLLLDHYGLLGYPLHPINPYRALGAALLLSGVILVRRIGVIIIF